MQSRGQFRAYLRHRRPTKISPAFKSAYAAWARKPSDYRLLNSLRHCVVKLRPFAHLRFSSSFDNKLLRRTHWPQFTRQLPHSRTSVLLTRRHIHLSRGMHQANSYLPTSRAPSQRCGEGALGSCSGHSRSNPTRDQMLLSAEHFRVPAGRRGSSGVTHPKEDS